MHLLLEERQMNTAPGEGLIGSVTRDLIVTRGDFHVRLADREEWLDRSRTLVSNMYSWRGYSSGLEGADARPDRFTFQACRDGEVFGTISVCIESYARLPADALYRSELDAYRISGAKTCELTHFAIARGHGSKRVLGTLFHVAYLYAAVVRHATDMFIEVNPRHALFYLRMLHFRKIGALKMCTRVNAPALLMHLSMDHVARQIERFGGHRNRTRTSLYPYALAAAEDRLLRLRMIREHLGEYMHEPVDGVLIPGLREGAAPMRLEGGPLSASWERDAAGLASVRPTRRTVRVA